MATAKMKKLNLAAMAYDRDAILNALQKTGATEVKLKKEDELTVPLIVDCENLRGYFSRAEAALEQLTADVNAYEAERKIKEGVLKDGFEISYSEFAAAPEMKDGADKVICKVESLHEEKAKNSSALQKVRKTLAAAAIYKDVKLPLCSICDTFSTRAKLGTVPLTAVEELNNRLSENPLWAFCELARNEEYALLGILFHKSAADDGLLQEFGFVQSPFAGDERTGEEIYCGLKKEEDELCWALKGADEELYALKPEIRGLKIYCDRLAFELEKAELAEKMRATDVTFLLEAYVPEEAEEIVKSALDGVTGAAYYEFTEPEEDEIPPTLYKNNKVVKNFEAITNMYSPANSREFDPNAVMAVFYSLFLGFIMGDSGYGLVMLVGGGTIYWLNRGKDNGLKRLAGVFAIGGICAILWGVLFNSFFGFAVFPITVMPALRGEGSNWHFMGISIPAVLLISLEIGIVQLFAGYICKAVQFWRRGEIFDGLCEGVTWALFSVGVALAIVGLIEEANASILTIVGGVIAGGSLLCAMLTAGRHEKVLGKFTKGFGAAYGVINYASDILSYARLYGLLLSGAVIAEIISGYSKDFILSGNVGLAILAIVLMLVGHAFNLAMGLLGAYIHDARLQYVEFYGRFFEGEGELFTPLGSSLKHTVLSSQK